MPSSEVDPENTERPRGILSKNERRYYTGELEVGTNSQKARNMRAGARKHLRHSLLDLIVIENYMEERDLRKVLDRDEVVIRSNSQYESPMDDAMDAMVSLMYFRFGKPELVEESVGRGMYEREIKSGYSSSVNVEIDVESREEIEYLERRLRNIGPEELSYRQLGDLHDAGKISPEEHMEYISEKSGE